MIEWSVNIPDSMGVQEEVAVALTEGRPVVALESSVIAQGLPRPANVEAAMGCEAAIRSEGAVPATIAVIDGLVKVGLSAAEIEWLASGTKVEKAGARDLGRAVASGASMATTVGATVIVARRTGIRVMATGGVGGAHRGVQLTGDVSNDLHALAATPVVVVSTGFKSILDLPRTLESLETLGVSLIGFQTANLPDFYRTSSGFVVPRLDTEEGVARMRTAQDSLGLTQAIVVANPPPVELAFSDRTLTAMVESATRSAAREGIAGKSLTPYLLGKIAELSGGRSVALNIALLVSNASLAARISSALARLVSAGDDRHLTSRKA